MLQRSWLIVDDFCIIFLWYLNRNNGPEYDIVNHLLNLPVKCYVETFNQTDIM